MDTIFDCDSDSVQVKYFFYPRYCCLQYSPNKLYLVGKMKTGTWI